MTSRNVVRHQGDDTETFHTKAQCPFVLTNVIFRREGGGGWKKDRVGRWNQGAVFLCGGDVQRTAVI